VLEPADDTNGTWRLRQPGFETKETLRRAEIQVSPLAVGHTPCQPLAFTSMEFNRTHDTLLVSMVG
jgi:hypothetical protein